MPPSWPIGRLAVALAGAGVLALVTVACDAGPAATPAITPGTAAAPREVVIIAKDYEFIPAMVDLVPGETVVFRVVNGGLVIHEAVVGPSAVQDAWETAEAATAGAPPGPTPEVSVVPELAGLRVVVASGDRRDVVWTVPSLAPVDPGGWFVGCHIPGHWAQGMVVRVRFVGRDGAPLPTPRASTGGTLREPVRAG